MGTLIWTDDFESYTAGSQISAPWTSVSNTPVSTVQAHGGTRSLAAGNSGNGSTASRPFGSNEAQWYADFWMWTNNAGTSDGHTQYISFSGSNNNNRVPCVGVNQSGAGICGLSGAGNATWFTFSVSVMVWHHYLLEMLSALAGTAKLTIDGTVAGTFSGDTRDGNNSNAFVSSVWVVGSVIGPSPPGEFFIDDLSIYSGVVTAGGGTQARAMVLA